MEKSENAANAAKELYRSPVKSQVVQIPQFELEKGKVKAKKYRGLNQASDYWLPFEDVQKIIGGCYNPRDRAIIMLLYYGMLRRHEARSLKIENIDFANGILHLKITKGTKDGRGKENPRSVPIVESAVFDAIRMHIGKRTSGWAFISNSKDGRLSNQAINEIVKQAAINAKITSPNPNRATVNPHLFRHSFARYLRRQAPPIAIEVLQKLLGHRNVSTTLNIYATADVNFMQAELRRCMKKEAGEV